MSKTRGSIRSSRESRGAAGIADWHRFGTLKAQLSMTITIFGVGLGMLGVLIMGLMISSTLGASVSIVKDEISSMNAIDAAHVVEYCLKNGGDYVSLKFLEGTKGKGNICNICDICETPIDVKVEDLTAGKEWWIKYTGFQAIGKFLGKAKDWVVDKIKVWAPDENKHQNANIIINIAVDTGAKEEIHTGRLNVWT